MLAPLRVMVLKGRESLVRNPVTLEDQVTNVGEYGTGNPFTLNQSADGSHLESRRSGRGLGLVG